MSVAECNHIVFSGGLSVKETKALRIVLGVQDK